MKRDRVSAARARFSSLEIGYGLGEDRFHTRLFAGPLLWLRPKPESVA